MLLLNKGMKPKEEIKQPFLHEKEIMNEEGDEMLNGIKISHPIKQSPLLPQ